MSEFIKTPRQLLVVVGLAFVVPILLIVLMVQFVAAGGRTGAGSEAMTVEAMEQRIMPVAGFRFSFSEAPKGVAAAATPTTAAPAAVAPTKAVAKLDGAAVYKAVCVACHASGVAGAPKLGDKAAWAARTAGGIDALLASVIKGKNAMPPRAGSKLSDEELRAGVQHMLDALK